MKNLIISALASVAILAGCNSAKQTSTGYNYDDIYYSKSNKPATQAPVDNSDDKSVTNAGEYSAQPNNLDNKNVDQSDANRFDYANGNTASPQTTTQQGSDGNTYITNNYYNNDDYYDYAYSSRIRRFYNPVGYGYYDNYYTNSYWYDYNPSSWGISIYSTYNWWAPAVYYSYNPYCCSGWSVSIGWGYSYGYNPYVYRPYYYPYGCFPSYGYGCCGGGYSPCGGGYNYGYNNGYWDGYYSGLYGNGYCPYYYNSYDNFTHYYGKHQTVKGSSGAGTPYYQGGRASTLNNNLASTYVNSVSPGIGSNNNPDIIAPVKSSTITGSGNNTGNIKGNVYNGNDVTGGVKSPASNPANSSINGGNSYIKNPDVKNNNNNGIINSSVPAGGTKGNMNVNSYSSQPSNPGDIKSGSAGDVKIKELPPSDIRNNNPNSEYYTPGINGGVKQPYSDPRYNNGNNDPRSNGNEPRNTYSNPGTGDIKNNGNVKSESPSNSNTGIGKSKWNNVFGGSKSDRNSGEVDNPKYAEPKKSSNSDYSKPKNDAPRQNSQPSYQQPRNNNSQPAPSRNNNSAQPRQSKPRQ